MICAGPSVKVHLDVYVDVKLNAQIKKDSIVFRKLESIPCSDICGKHRAMVLMSSRSSTEGNAIINVLAHHFVEPVKLNCMQ